MRPTTKHRDEGFISPGVLVVVVVFAALAIGLIQIGSAAERSTRGQIAADAAALAAASAAFDVDGDGIFTPGSGSASNPELPPAQRAEKAAQDYAVKNMPGLDPDDITIVLGANRVAVEVVDRREGPADNGPVDARPAQNVSRATAAVIVCAPAGSASAPGCAPGSRSVRLVR